MKTTEETKEIELEKMIERETTIRGIWDALDDDEKAYVLAKAGYEV